MKTTAAVVGFVLILLGLSGIGWMFPLFTLNEPYKTWYIERVLHVDAKPGGSGAAITTCPVPPGATGSP